MLEGSTRLSGIEPDLFMYKVYTLQPLKSFFKTTYPLGAPFFLLFWDVRQALVPCPLVLSVHSWEIVCSVGIEHRLAMCKSSVLLIALSF